MPKQIARKLLGEYLVDKKIITKAQLEEALKGQSRTGEPLGNIVVKKGFATELEVVRTLSEQLSIAYVDISSYQVDPEVIKLLPAVKAREIEAIPLFKMEDTLTVAMVNPLNVLSIDNLRSITGCEIDPVFGTPSAIKDAIDRYYGTLDQFKEVIKNIQAEDGVSAHGKDDAPALSALVKAAQETPVIKLVNLIIERAVSDGASDIHMEPDEMEFFLRYRIDGVLYDYDPPPRKLQSAMISRVKIMANMDIAEKRLPQDGRIQLKSKGKDIDIRVSTFPTVFGENLVMRILDKSRGILKMEDLGMSKEALEHFKALIARPNGIVMVTGPTGSGKTTTLYAVLSMLNSVDKNIITLEDPVEYQINRVRQSQIDVKSGLTFANGLRSIVRQDPDIIMIGEIRDLETAEIAIHAALTGHLVFSTLHTNDAPSAITRLIDMGVEPFLVSSAISGILAQRLVRKLCDKCKVPYSPTDELKKSLGLSSVKGEYFEQKGCEACHNMGYSGRIGLFELMVQDDEIRQLVVEKASASRIAAKAKEKGMIMLREDGLRLAAKGLTTLSEIMRVTQA